MTVNWPWLAFAALLALPYLYAGARRLWRLWRLRRRRRRRRPRPYRCPRCGGPLDAGGKGCFCRLPF
jgi:hypothetical protein